MGKIKLLQKKKRKNLAEDELIIPVTNHMRKRSVYSGYVVLEEPAEEFQVREQSETITQYSVTTKFIIK